MTKIHTYVWYSVMLIFFSVWPFIWDNRLFMFQPVSDQRGQWSVHSRLAGRVGGLVGGGVAGLSAPPGRRWHTPASGRHRRTRRHCRFGIRPGNLSNWPGQKSAKFRGGKIWEIFIRQSQQRRPRIAVLHAFNPKGHQTLLYFFSR